MRAMPDTTVRLRPCPTCGGPLGRAGGHWCAIVEDPDGCIVAAGSIEAMEAALRLFRGSRQR